MICGSASTVWMRLPPPSCSRMMLPLLASTSVEHALHDIVRRRRLFAAGFAPIVRIDAPADEHVAHLLRHGQHLDFGGGFRLVIDSVRRAEERGLHAQAAFDQEFREVQLNFEVGLLDRLEFGVRERVVADFLAERILALHDVVVRVGIFADHEESARRLFLFQDIENFRRPVGIGAVVEGQRHFVRRGAHLLNAPRHRIALEAFVVEVIRARVVIERSRAALAASR